MHVYFILIKSLKTIMMFRPDPTSLGLGTRSSIKVPRHSSLAARKPGLQARKGKHLCLHSRLFMVSSHISFSTMFLLLVPLLFCANNTKHLVDLQDVWRSTLCLLDHLHRLILPVGLPSSWLEVWKVVILHGQLKT